MSAFIRIRCSGCQARIKAPSQLLGQTRPCPNCGRLVAIQRTAPADAGPILLWDRLRAPAAASAKVEGKLILVADDDVDLNNGLRSVLEKRGYRVIQAADGVQAKELIRQERPDLMILDLKMPRLGGYPVLEHLRAKPDAPPVIMITADAGVQHKANAARLGVVDFLPKPFTMGRLLQSVEKELGPPPN